MVEKLHLDGSAFLGEGRRAYSPSRRRAKGGAAPSSSTSSPALRRPPGWIRQALGAAAGLVYPSLCPGCGDAVAEVGGLCAPCWRDVTFIAAPACGLCGAPVASEMGGETGGRTAAGFGGENGGARTVCDSCAHAPPAWSRGVAAVVYEGVARQLALRLKHGDRLDLAAVAGTWMRRAAPDLVAEADVIAPAPLAWSRMVQRRYNQAGELAHAVATGAGRRDALAPDLLARVRRTESQGGKTRAERFRNMEGAFAPGPSARRASGAKVLLIDDVLTTGATLSACAEACRAAGAADVTVLVMARVAREDWPA